MGPVLQDDALGGDAHLLHQVVLRFKLAVEGILCAVAVEGGRQIAGFERLRIHRGHAEPSVEGVDHACRRSVCRDGIQLVGDIVRVEGRSIDLPVKVEEKLAGLDASGGVAHHRDVVRVDAVSIRILSDKAHRAGYIQSSFPHRDSGDVWAEIVAVIVAGHVFGKFGLCWDVPFLPQVQHLDFGGVGCSIENGLVIFRLRQLAVQFVVFPLRLDAAAIVVSCREIGRGCQRIL